MDTKKKTVKTIKIDDQQYPENLSVIPNSPSALYVEGTLLPSDRLAIAIVGTRSPSPEGRILAYRLGRDLGSVGVTVVSGLAYGIDTETHKGALDAGARTFACLGSGTDIVYPKSNKRLFERIKEHGALISEYPPGTKPQRWTFPARNRIIAGLSLGVVVVQAPEKSGALITADWALKFGRPVMVFPGSVLSRKNIGSNRLIQDGAYLVTGAEDVLSFLKQETEYVPEFTNGKTESTRPITLEEGAVLNVLEDGIQTLDTLMIKSGLSPRKVLTVISSLEIRGLITRLAGQKYASTQKFKRG
jgi:DNA processing protein